MMRRFVMVVAFLPLLAVLGWARVQAAEGPTQAEYEQLKKEVEDLRKKMATTTPVASRTAVDSALDNKYGPNATVTSKQGKLTIGGLLQVWAYTIQNDNIGWVDANQANGGPGAGFGSNEVNDNDSFRIRRTELKFTMDITENVTAVVMIDPAQEAQSFPSYPSNLGTSGLAFANAGFTPDPDDETAGLPAGNPRNDIVRNGTGLANRSLQDAYIHFHGLVPHHDTQIGQFKRHLGEEGIRDSSKLDFVERAMITQLADERDMGAQTHGTWWCDRFQYWIGSFNTPGTAFQQRRNRSDDNDEKDFLAAILLRPLWKDETWGSIELGWSISIGTGGESAGHTPGNPDTQVDGLNRRQTTHMLQYAYGSYHPGGPVRGWWIRGEWGQYRDRFAPSEVIGPAEGAGTVVPNPAPFDIQGWYVSTGYKLADSRWGEGLKCGGTLERLVLHPIEFAFRYEVMQNLFLPDLVYSTRRLDVFKTQVVTAGINYYIKGNNAKIQLNYNWVDEEDKVDRADTFREVREVRNDSLIVNFQVAW